MLLWSGRVWGDTLKTLLNVYLFKNKNSENMVRLCIQYYSVQNFFKKTLLTRLLKYFLVKKFVVLSGLVKNFYFKTLKVNIFFINYPCEFEDLKYRCFEDTCY